MLGTIKSLLDKDPFISLCIFCIIFIIIYGIYSLITQKKGSWSTKYYYTNSKKMDTVNINKTKFKGDSKGEIECRRVLEETFHRSFGKARPNFLSNPVTGGNFNLELDCYNKDLHLAVEYQGIQHYKYTPYFHKNNETFLNQKYRDELKRRICKDNIITLIEVPYTIKIENIDEYLKKELFNYGFL